MPGKELPASCLRREKIPIGGIGATTVYAEGEYLVAMETTDGKAQQMQGLTVQSITSEFPKINISEAVAEVKRGAPNKKSVELQRCRFPESVGGLVDCLIGIQYSQLQPRLIHMLPSGLAIYKTKLAPHIKGYNYVLGGSHRSFDVWLSECGHQTHFLLENFIAGLANWRTLGAPSLTQFIMSEQEIITAKEKNLADTEADFYQQLVDHEANEISAVQEEIDRRIHQHETNVSVFRDDPVNLENEFAADSNSFPCCDCGDMVQDIFTLYDDEKLTRLKHIIDAQETGIEISYRCVRCRECLDCRNAEKVDKISLREESEDYEIRNSVKLDWDSKKIIVSLPLRGRERDFLTSNESRALKVLESQCRRYFSDEPTRISVNEAFKKLINKGFIKFLKDMTDLEKDKFLSKEVQYFLPWRLQFKPDSASTPVRVVFDASSSTNKRKDNTGGRCLNDLVCKGSIDTLDLMRVILRFMIGPFALIADISKMYNQFSLLPEYWNLQRIMIKDNLDPQAPVQHACVTTAIYGVKSSSGQTEHGLREVANCIRDEKPQVADLLTTGRYVDNLLESKVTKEETIQLAKDTIEVLDRLSIPTKGFSFSFEDPQPEETVDGISIDVNGMKWITGVDAVEIKIPPLHFGTKRRGRVVGVDIFEGGNFAKMDQFVPKVLTRRMIVSKRASLYDFLGKLEPIKAKLKIDEREVVLLTRGWDDAVDPNIRNKWLHNFLLLEQLRGIRFSRARMPLTAVDTKMRLITLVDAAQSVIMMVTYCGFKLTDGSWSCQQLLGRSALGNATIPRNELAGNSGGSNLACIVRKGLSDWVDSSIQASDSEIALHWIVSDSRRLGMWHRNRVIQVRRNMDFKDLFYVSTESNVADVGTRAEKVSVQDVGPESRYENGDEWMHWEVSEAVEKGILRNISELKAISREKEEEYREGLLLEKEPEILTRGHVADEIEIIQNRRVEKMLERAQFSNYGNLLPTRRAFPSMVRIASYVIAFVSKCKKAVGVKKGVMCDWSGNLLKESSIWFSAFPVSTMTSNKTIPCVAASISNSSGSSSSLTEAFRTCKSNKIFHLVHSENLMPTDQYLNGALLYYFRKASLEVLEFNSQKVIQARTESKDGILLSKGRIIDGMNFIETADLDTLNLGSLCIKTKIPVIDRFSPLAYSIAQHFHWTVMQHKGVESCHRYSLEHVHILQGMSLFKELSEECIRCKMRRGKFIRASLGPLSDKQLIIAPPFYACQIDLCGPFRVFVPGFEKETRSSKVKESKVWILVAVCVVTSTVNLQVCEMKDTTAMLEAFIRLSCEVGYPKYVMCDKESSLLAALSEAQVNLRDLSHKLYSEHGVLFETCAVGGHDQHGKVERTIRTIQDSLDAAGWKLLRLHAMGVQTLCKQVENAYNNLPLGYRYERAHDNTQILKMLVPNMLRIGRVNSRTLDGPVRLSNESRKMLGDIEEKYAAWYKIWCDVYVPKIMHQKRNFKNDRDLQKNDLVYYQKKEGHLDNVWVLGRVDQVVRGRDGIIRKVFVKYFNSKEDFGRVTERSARTLIKIWSADDPDLQADLSKIQKRIDELCGLNNSQGVGSISVCDVHQGVLARPTHGLVMMCKCCCRSHCRVNFHNIYGSKVFYPDVKKNDSLFESTVHGVSEEDESSLLADEEEDVGEEMTDDGLLKKMMRIGVSYF